MKRFSTSGWRTVSLALLSIVLLARGTAMGHAASGHGLKSLIERSWSDLDLSEEIRRPSVNF